MRSIDIYVYKRNNRGFNGDVGDSGDGCPLPEAGNSLPVDLSSPFNISPEYIEDYLEREAILVIDGYVEPAVARVRAFVEIVTRYGVKCITNSKNMEVI